MQQTIKEGLWTQFGASIDMLENAINLCPDELWDNDKYFWYWSYHCLFWLDYYLSLDPKNFAPHSPFTMSEFDPSGKLPDRVYTKNELLDYLEHGRLKCHKLISNMTEEQASSRWISETKNYSLVEILLYNMRHVQHHAAQLNKILRQEIDDAPRWVSIPKKSL